MIAIENVSWKIGAAPILSDVSLRLPRGGVTALIGPNGAGKSSLLSLIARLQPLQQGRIMVDELEVGACCDRALARRLAVMTQSAHLPSRLRVRELIAFGRHPWHGGRPRPEDRRIAEAAIERFGLGHLADRFLDALSGGQKQLARAAMCYAQGADYMLLDEPLNNLDIAASRRLMGLMRDLAREDGRSVLCVLHDVNYAAAYADRIVVMKEGRVIADGAPAEVIAPAPLERAFGIHVDVGQVGGRPVALV